MIQLIVLSLLTGSLESSSADIMYPVFRDEPHKHIDLPQISPEDIKESFSHARTQAAKRDKEEKDFLKTDHVLTSDITTSGRLFDKAFPKAMEVHHLEEQFEDAAKYLANKFSLTVDEIRFGLPFLELPADEEVVQQCRKLREVPSCDVEAKYRTLDGACNNIQHPHWGKTYTCSRGLSGDNYKDGISSPRISAKDGGGLPNPRFLSGEVYFDINVPSKTITHMIISFGEFLVYDMIHSASPVAGNNKAYTCCPVDSSIPVPQSCFPIEVPIDDRFYSGFNLSCMNFVRSAGCSSDCTLGDARQFVNEQTAYIDGSMMYGDTTEMLSKLRSFENGKMKVQETEHGDLLTTSLNPKEDQCSAAMGKYKCFYSAEMNNDPLVASMYTLWLRQHNKVAETLAKSDPKATDEVLFQETRRIIAAQIQAVTYKELLPAILGPDYTQYFNLGVLENGFSTYNSSKSPSIIKEFSTAVFRFGHSMIQNSFSLIGQDGKAESAESLRFNQMHPILLYQGKLDSIMRGLFHQSAQEFDENFVNVIINHLMEAPGQEYGFDLEAIGIQRSRDHGLLTYTQALKYCFNLSIRDFDDLNLTMHDGNWKMLQSAYSSVEDLDLWNSFLERPVHEGIVGPTAACIIGLQFQDSKFGDRFFFEHGDQAGSFTEGQLKELRKTTLARIICDNSDSIKSITPNVFRKEHTGNEVIDCDAIPSPDFSSWLK